MSEVKAMQDFHRLMTLEPDRAWYGYEQVRRAHLQRAVQTLMVTDTLFKSKDVQERRRYVQLVEDVKQAGGDVLLLSAQHVSGEELTQLTGVAAILRFGIDETEMEEAGAAADAGAAEGQQEEQEEKKESSSSEPEEALL
jgi:protein pelota